MDIVKKYLNPLPEEPNISQDTKIVDCNLGRYTEIYSGVSILECSLGDFTYMAEYSSAVYSIIGKFCSIAPHSSINPGNHPLHKAALHHFTYRSTKYGLDTSDDEDFFQWRRGNSVILGNDVWIGYGAVVLPGVTIGTGSAVGAGAIVTKDVPPFTIVGGSPAQEIRKRFDDTVCGAMMRIGWWDWEYSDLKNRLKDFRDLSAVEFVRKYDPGF